MLTPNRRLAGALKAEFDQAQQQRGLVAWAAPDILPASTFLERTFRQIAIQSQGGSRPHLIDTAQSQLLWEQVIRKSNAGEALLSTTAAARQAGAAWQIVNAWRLLPAMRGYPLHDDGVVFMQWASRYQHLAREKNFVDPAMLPDAIIDAINTHHGARTLLPRHIYTAAFDIVTPQFERFLGELVAVGCSVGAIADNPAPVNASVNRREYTADRDELRACAAWARAALLQDPKLRIGIVVPDLRGKRGEVERTFRDALAPGASVAAYQSARALADESARAPVASMNVDATANAAAAASNVFNITLGLPLGEYALVNDAVGLIEFALGKRLPFDTVSALLRSVHIAAAEREMSARAKLDAALRESLGQQVDIAGLNRRLQSGHDRRLQMAASDAGVFCETIDALVNANRRTSAASRKGAAQVTPRTTATTATAAEASWSSAKGPADWAQLFSALLSQWGFPGERPLDSASHQLLAKFRDAIQQLAAMQVVLPRLREDEALASLRRILADTVFQPESEGAMPAPVQVMGVLESAGQRFDRLWVTGLTEAAWPIAARPNPFIPAALQRRVGIPEASPAASLALDEKITAGWLRAADEIIFSHARHETDAAEAPRLASALTRSVPLAASEIATMLPTYAEGLQLANARQVLQPIPDSLSPALPAPTFVSGGASVMRDQAACPFRAFARHRLGAKPLNTPQAGLDAAERGILLHRVLSTVWSQIGQQAALLEMSDAALNTLVASAVERALIASHAAGSENLVGRFAAIEQQRLTSLVLDWLRLERQRAPFEVVACERAKDVTLGPIAMSLRLDRMDRLDDGTHALIDYKSGNASAKSWLGERPDEPQLPLYWRTADEEISVLAFARLKRGKSFGFEGVSAVEGALPNVGPIEARRGMPAAGYVSWDVLTQEWETSLASLAAQFQRGVATVDPKLGALTCKQCDLQTLCRVAEYAGTGTDTNESGDSAGLIAEADDA